MCRYLDVDIYLEYICKTEKGPGKEFKSNDYNLYNIRG